MDTRMIRCRILVNDEGYRIGIIKDHMCSVYVLLDLLNEGDLKEICLWDQEGGRKICLSRSSDGRNSVDEAQISLNGDGIACMKKLISQCFLNPYDAGWLHYDIDLCSGSGKDMTLCVCLK